MHQRYFIGLTLPEHLSEKIRSAQNELFAGHKLMAPLTPHITLLHPNILMTLSPMYLLPKIKEVSQKSLPIEVNLKEVGRFDDRVLHISVNSPALLILQKQLVELLPEDIRARYEIGRDYTPHVTLAQAKPMQKLDPELISHFSATIKPLLPLKFEVNSLSKFTWIKPREYRVESV